MPFRERVTDFSDEVSSYRSGTDGKSVKIQDSFFAARFHIHRDNKYLVHKIPFILSFSYNVFKRSRKKNKEIKAGNVMKEWSERRSRYGTIKE